MQNISRLRFANNVVHPFHGWIRPEKLGPDVPLRFSAFHPDYKMTDVAPTPPATLRHARQIALDTGLHHVYVGNVHDTEGDNTYSGLWQTCDRASLVPAR